MKYFTPGQLVRIKRTREVFVVVNDNGALVQVRNEKGIHWLYRDILTRRNVRETTASTSEEKSSH